MYPDPLRFAEIGFYLTPGNESSVLAPPALWTRLRLQMADQAITDLDGATLRTGLVYRFDLHHEAIDYLSSSSILGQEEPADQAIPKGSSEYSPPIHRGDSWGCLLGYPSRRDGVNGDVDARRPSGTPNMQRRRFKPALQRAGYCQSVPDGTKMRSRPMFVGRRLHS